MKRTKLTLSSRLALGFIAAVAAGSALTGCRVSSSEPRLWVYAERVFYPGEDVRVEVEARGIGEVDMKLFRVDLVKLATREGLDLHSLDSVVWRDADVVAEWHQKLAGGGEWKYEEIAIPVKGEGAYVVVATARGYAAAALVIVSRMALVTKCDSDTLLAFVADRMTGLPEEGVTVVTLPAVTPPLVTDRKGLARYDGIRVPEGDNDFIVLAHKGGSVVVCDSYFGYYSYDRYKGYTFTDRPVYRPGQTVRMKGILRHYNGTEYENLPGEEVTVEVTTPGGDTVFKTDVTTSEFGSYATEFTLDEEPPLGQYYIVTKFRDQTFTSYFNVEEYRKPEYLVTVTAERPYYLAGEVVNFEVRGKYYFGEPVARADVRYVVWRRPKYIYRWYYAAYDWYYAGGEYDDAYGWEYVAEETGRLDEEGVFRGIFAVPRELNYNYDYRIEAVMTDISRREVAGSVTFPIWRAAFSLGITTGRYFYQAGDKVALTFRSRDPLGKPYAAPVAFDIYTFRWEETRGSGEWREERVVSGRVHIGETGEAVYEFMAKEEGYYEVRARGNDAGGRMAEATTYFYVIGEGQRRSYYTGGGISVMTDKETYAPGETAVVMVQSSREGGAILLTAEGDELYYADVVTPAGNAAVIRLPIERRLAPNFYIGALSVFNNSYTTAGADVVVPPEDRFLNLEITADKENYQPRDEATFKIRASDFTGKPTRAEVSLGVADEAVYAIRPEKTPDIRRFFYDRRGNYVATNTSFYFYSYGRGFGMGRGEGGIGAADTLAAESPAPAGVKKEKDGGEFVEPVVRSYFPDTAFWGPQLVTDAQGEAVVQFQMPDSLTTWRATARAVTADTAVGAAMKTVVTRKDLLIRLETPRFLTQYDDTVITGVVHNYLPQAYNVRVELTAGPEVEIKGEKEYSLNLAAGAEARVDWRCRVAKSGETTFTARALTTASSDAMAVTVPILPYGLPYVTASARVEAASFDEHIVVPAEALSGATTLEVSVAPSLAGTMLEALSYLAGYPYGCVEQTMSRFLPTVYVAHTLRALGLRDEKLEAELPKMVNAGLERLYKFQHGDGGWGWWEDDDTHPFMTAYVCYGLLKAREAGFPVKEEVLTRGLTSLKDQMNSKGSREGATSLYMTAVLAEAGDEAADGYLMRAFRKRGDYDAYQLALLTMGLARRGKMEQSHAAARDLWAKAAREGNLVHFAGVGEWHYSWEESPVQTTAAALRALIAAEAPGVTDEDLGAVVRWLTLQRRGNYWRSTQETASVVFALADYLRRTKELEGNYTAGVFLNGRQVGELVVTPANVANAKLHLTFKDKDGVLKPGDNDLRVEVAGMGKVYFSTSLTYYRTAERLAPVSEGFVVSRKYTALRSGDQHVNPTRELVKSGDRFRVDVTFKNDRPTEYVMLEDYLPSGFEVDEETTRNDYYYDWYYRNFHSERRDEKMAFFFTALPAGEHTVSYVIHAEQPGYHRALPARASLMYAPEVWGSSADDSFNVELEKPF